MLDRMLETIFGVLVIDVLHDIIFPSSPHSAGLAQGGEAKRWQGRVVQVQWAG